MSSIKLLAETADAVTISRADFDALLDQGEDIEDLGAVRGQRLHEARVGYEAAKADYLTGEEAKRLLDGESPLRVWREKRGMTQRALSESAAIPPGYLSEIESGKKPGSVAAFKAIAKALRVTIEHLLDE